MWALLVQYLPAWEDRISQASEASGLSPVSAWALVQLDPEHAISQRELAKRLHCNPSTVVDPTDRLEERRLVARKPHPTDRRINILTVTARGRQVRTQLIDRLFEPPAALRRLPPDQLARLSDALLSAVSEISSPQPEPRSKAASRS